MKVSVKKRSLGKLASSYASLVQKRDALKVKHAVVFDKLDAIETELEAVALLIRELAREKAVAGETHKLIDEEGILVEVSGPMKAVQYDYAIAAKRWPKSVLRQAIRLDSSTVEKLINAGDLAEDDAEEAALPREALSARVTIKALAKK